MFGMDLGTGPDPTFCPEDASVAKYETRRRAPVIIKMEQHPKYIYGYPVDMMEIINYALVHYSNLATLMKTEPIQIWQIQVFRTVTRELGCNAGIPDLGNQIVWIGKGKRGLCLSLPERFQKKRLREKDEEGLKKLQTLLGMGDPIRFTHYDYPEPEHMKNLQISQNIAPFSLEDVIEAFLLDGKGIIERLLAGVEPEKAMYPHPESQD